jgi:hypothetical protein
MPGPAPRRDALDLLAEGFAPLVVALERRGLL